MSLLENAVYWSTVYEIHLFISLINSFYIEQ
jgi:hypothetical protein